MKTKKTFGYGAQKLLCASAVMIALAFTACDDGTDSGEGGNSSSNGISLNAYSLSLTVGQSSVLTATVLPDTASQNVVWASSDSSVAAVANGTVTGVSAGMAKITATSAVGPSKTAACNVTVTGVSGPLPPGYEMVYVSGGSFQMGKNTGIGDAYDERPVVTLSAFYIGKYEVTQKLYVSVITPNPSRYTSNSNLPVEQVSWYDAVEFCNKLSEREGLTPYYTINKSQKDTNNLNAEGTDERWLITTNNSATGYRLPTEAEWEYAAKGGNGSRDDLIYSGSNNAADVAHYNDNGGTVVVGTKAPNGLGLYDMSGNVLEWCWDWYGTYPNAAQTDPNGPSSGSYRVQRGGAFNSILPVAVSCVYRDYRRPGQSPSYVGFRLARSAQ